MRTRGACPRTVRRARRLLSSELIDRMREQRWTRTPTEWVAVARPEPGLPLVLAVAATALWVVPGRAGSSPPARVWCGERSQADRPDARRIAGAFLYAVPADGEDRGERRASSSRPSRRSESCSSARVPGAKDPTWALRRAASSGARCARHTIDRAFSDAGLRKTRFLKLERQASPRRPTCLWHFLCRRAERSAPRAGAARCHGHGRVCERRLDIGHPSMTR